MPSLEASCISSLLLGITRAMSLQCLAQGRLSIYTFFFFFSGIVEYSRKKYRTHGQTDVTTPISIQLLKFPSHCDLTSQIITPTS